MKGPVGRSAVTSEGQGRAKCLLPGPPPPAPAGTSCVSCSPRLAGKPLPPVTLAWQSPHRAQECGSLRHPHRRLPMGPLDRAAHLKGELGLALRLPPDDDRHQ